MRAALDVTALLAGRSTSRARYAAGLAAELPALLGPDEHLILAWKLSRFRQRAALSAPRSRAVTRRPYLRSFASWMAPCDVFHCTRRGGPDRHSGAILEMVHSLDMLFGDYSPATDEKARAMTANLVRRDGLIFHTQAARRRLLERLEFPESRTYVAALGFDPADFKPEPEPDDEDVRRRHGLARPYVLCVGTIERRKNQALLCEAFARAPAARDLELVFAGADLYYAEEVHEAASHHLAERGRFLGNVPAADLPALYRGARAFALPSLYEELGLVFHEALASGTPSLLPDLDTTREIFDGCAVFAEPSSLEALSGGLQTLLADETARVDLRRAGLERVREYTWSRVAARTLDIYRHLASQGPRDQATVTR